MDIKQYLHSLLQLIKLEREEDMQQFQNKMLNTAIPDRKKEGITWYPVVMMGHHLGTGEKLVLEIEKTSDFAQKHSFQGGATISLFCNDGSKKLSQISGVASYVRDRKMKIVLNSDDLPEWINDGKLGVNLMYDESSYKEMESTIQYLNRLETGRTAELRDILYGNKPPQFVKEYPISIPNLNPVQNQALQKLISAKDIAIIHGPPGTGKTTTLVQAIKYTVESEKQVLVCTPSNASVDLLVEKLVAQGLEVLRIGHPARISDAAIANSLDARIVAHTSYRDLRAVRKKAEELRELGYKYKRNFGPTEREQRKLILTEAGRLKDEAGMLEKYIVQSLLDKAQVVVSTLAGSNNNLLRGKVFKTVFIDEAGQALEPACWIPMLKAERVVMAGDHMQLPPTVKSYEAAKAGLSYTLFERIMEKLNVDTMLSTQYRMHPDIMSFSSKVFYNNRLEVADSINSRVTYTNDPVTFIDTAGCGFFEEQAGESKSTINKEEAALLIKLVAEKVEEIGLETVREHGLTFGIIAPYKAQVSLLGDLAADWVASNGLEELISVNTIDAFQGQERDFIYISLTRSNEAGQIGFLKDKRRMNVAMTRAKQQLVVIGDSATLSNDTFYDSMITHYQEMEAYRSAFEYL
jgi:ATP-dependent RNA/DNA helicase IGHMBP2